MRGRFIHRSAWKGNSAKFALMWFSDVAQLALCFEAPDEGISQCLLARVVPHVEAEPVRRVGETHPHIGVGVAERATDAWGAESLLTRPEVEGREGFHVPKETRVSVCKTISRVPREGATAGVVRASIAS